MTNTELSKAKAIFKLYKQGKEDVLKSLSHGGIKSFLNTYLGVTQEKIESITEEEMLKTAFLTVSQNNNSNLFVFINLIQRLNDRIDDAQPDLMSINWEDDEKWKEKGMRLFELYCNLETNRPLLIEIDNRLPFLEKAYIIHLPDYNPQTETYHYSSQSLEKITKGAATEKYNGLQLYYFRELLKASKKEDVVEQIKSLTLEKARNICSEK